MCIRDRPIAAEGLGEATTTTITTSGGMEQNENVFQASTLMKIRISMPKKKQYGQTWNQSATGLDDFEKPEISHHKVGYYKWQEVHKFVKCQVSLKNKELLIVEKHHYIQGLSLIHI